MIDDKRHAGVFLRDRRDLRGVLGKHVELDDGSQFVNSVPHGGVGFRDQDRLVVVHGVEPEPGHASLRDTIHNL